MIKKFFICASIVELSAGVIYLLCKREKSRDAASKLVNNKEKFESKPQKEDIFQRDNVVEKMYQAKSESVQVVNERHSKAGEIMKNAYRNVMEDFVEDFSDEKGETEQEESKGVIVDSESVSIMKELDSISDELDDLLK